MYPAQNLAIGEDTEPESQPVNPSGILSRQTTISSNAQTSAKDQPNKPDSLVNGDNKPSKSQSCQLPSDSSDLTSPQNRRSSIFDLFRRSSSS